jgi:hypothetical protein
MSRTTRAFKTSRLYLYALIACSALCAQPAAAARGSFGIPPAATTGDGGTTINGAVITLPDAGAPSFTMTFVLPRDYKTDSAIRIVVYLSTFLGTPCSVRFLPVALVRTRVGANIVNNPGGLSTPSPYITFPSIGRAVQKTYRLTPGGGLAGQNKGDAITIAFRRDAGDPGDTCIGDALVHSIDIRYELAP